MIGFVLVFKMSDNCTTVWKGSNFGIKLSESSFKAQVNSFCGLLFFYKSAPQDVIHETLINMVVSGSGVCFFSRSVKLIKSWYSHFRSIAIFGLLITEVSKYDGLAGENKLLKGRFFLHVKAGQFPILQRKRKKRQLC